MEILEAERNPAPKRRRIDIQNKQNISKVQQERKKKRVEERKRRMQSRKIDWDFTGPLSIKNIHSLLKKNRN